ncbi:MAG: hypothetical protein EXS09_03850 [Gemmataceae bacterium]|nr:hypothetical protein [Gemmataceae bacterium]
MSFQEFTFPVVSRSLGLTLRDADLFTSASPLPVRPEFQADIMQNAGLARAIDTEKARSEFLIAPVLLELHKLLNRSFGLFSGVELNADASRGLNGVCDFFLTRETMQFVVTAPILAITEAKNDNVRSGLWQCIASMVVAQMLNENAGRPTTIYGVSTTGTDWQFMRHVATELTLDRQLYFIDNLGKILGVLKRIVQT